LSAQDRTQSARLVSSSEWIPRRDDELSFPDITTVSREVLITPYHPIDQPIVPLLWLPKSRGVQIIDPTRLQQPDPDLGSRVIMTQLRVTANGGYELSPSSDDDVKSVTQEAIRLLMDVATPEIEWDEFQSTVATIIVSDAASAWNFLVQSRLLNLVRRDVPRPASDAGPSGSQPHAEPVVLLGSEDARRRRRLAKLLIRAALGEVISATCPPHLEPESIRFSFIYPLTWHRRTFRASLGLEGVGFEFSVPTLGAGAAYSVEVEAPSGCEILGCDLRGYGVPPEAPSEATDVEASSPTQAGPAVSTHPISERARAMYHGMVIREYPRKASRRAGWAVLQEVGRSLTRRKWAAARKTRFGSRVRVSVDGTDEDLAGFMTLWLSFERRSMRTYLLAALLIFATLGFLDIRLGLAWLPRFGLITVHDNSVARYWLLTHSSSSAAVTALLAPAAFSAFLSRPSEHLILSQLLRPVRLMVMVAAVPVFLAALFLAMDVETCVFAALLTGATAYALFALVMLTVAYRNCERPGRRQVVARWAIRIQLWRLARATKVVDKYTNRGKAELSPLQSIRMTMATRIVESVEDPGYSFAERWEDLETVVQRYLKDRSLESLREWKAPREMPFETLDQWALYTVRLIHAEGPELPNLTALLPGGGHGPSGSTQRVGATEGGNPGPATPADT